MPIAPHDNSAVEPSQDFSVAEIFAIRGQNTNENPLSLNTEEMTVLKNFIMGPRHIKRRKGTSLIGTDPGSITKIIALGHLEQDSGSTLLMLGNNGDLYKLVAGTWTVSDKTNYDITNDAQIVTFSSKNGSSLVTGTSSSGTTKYIIEDASKSWTPGEFDGKCVVIRGEVKNIVSNTATTLFLSDRLNRELDTDYQSQAYAIYEVEPVAIIANGVDFVQKYNLTTHVPLDGTHVSGAEPVPKFRHLAVHQGRLWGTKGSGDDNDKVSISDIAIAENFTKDTNLNINLSFQNDGDEVTGIVSLPLVDGSVLLVTKNRSVHTVDGATILDYAAQVRFTAAGCIASKTLRVAGRSAFMLDYSGILRFSGDGSSALLDKPVPISEPIESELKAYAESDLRDACAEVFDNKYILCVGTKVFMYDIVESLKREQHIWSQLEYPWSFSQLHAANNALYAGAKTSGQVFQLFTGNNDNGIRITGTIETSWITAPGAPTYWMERIEIAADKSDDVVIRLAYAKDGSDDFSSYITATLDTNLGVYRFPIKDHATSFKFRIIDNDTGAAVKIAMPIRLFYSTEAFGIRETKAALSS